MPNRQLTTSSAPTTISFKQSALSSTSYLPIRMDISRVHGHQDRHKLWHELDRREQINVHADRQANAIYRKPQQTGLFPSWIPCTRAALFHCDQQVTKGILSYIRDAAHMPAMKEYLIRRSKEATGRDKSWNEATYNSIDWRHHSEVFKKLSNGRRVQISKYINNLFPTKQRLATFDNRVDGRCFACNQLWEDTTHVLTCTCDARCEARKAARLFLRSRDDLPAKTNANAHTQHLDQHDLQ
jgi:hypothetical protein